jgi:aspartyl-tRNA synthetase
MGWVANYRNLGGLLFVDLRDREGIAQLNFNPEVNAEAHLKAQKLRHEYVIAVRGLVEKRPGNAIMAGKKGGEVEVIVSDLKILNTAKTPPFMIEDEVDAHENLRLKYRYLDLRRPTLTRNLILRHQINQYTRHYLANHGFLELETPFLIKSTPEGARDYLVPSRVNQGRFYALPQSPQMFKQLFMVAGFDRYFQIVRCFRDEDLRADRQPEFTQIDIEMSFPRIEEFFALMEGLVADIFQKVKGIDIPRPFKIMPYSEAMRRYGSDKPDTRFGLELFYLDTLLANTNFGVFRDTLARGGRVAGIRIEGGAKFSRKEIDDFGKFVTTFGAKGLFFAKVGPAGSWSGSLNKLEPAEVTAVNELSGAQEGDLLFVLADTEHTVWQALGALRLQLGEKLNLIKPDLFNFLWVVDFPMFEYDQDNQRHVAMHHPFTAPKEEDFDLLASDPGRVRAKAYDMVLNGSEVGGGSFRIHQMELQEQVFKLLGFTSEDLERKFGFFLEALNYGTPPHGGMAFGMDRLVAIITGNKYIRDVIAFPKTQKATCLTTDAPSVVDSVQLEELALRIIPPKTETN